MIHGYWGMIFMALGVDLPVSQLPEFNSQLSEHNSERWRSSCSLEIDSEAPEIDLKEFEVDSGR